MSEASGQPPPNGPSRLKLILVIIVALLAIVVAAHAVAAAVAPPRVAIWTIEREPLLYTVVASGRVEARRAIPVIVLAEGPVLTVEVEEGDTVSAGVVLMTVDSAVASALRASTTADVARAEARLIEIKNQGQALARARLRQASVELANARRNVERMKTMSSLGAVPTKALEDAEAALASAEERQSSASLELQATEPNGSRSASLAADLAVARAAFVEANLALTRTAVRSPMRAVVLRRMIDPGAIVRPGDSVLQLLPLGDTYIGMDVDERAAAELRVGQSATAVADAVPEQPFSADVVRLSPSVDPERGTLGVRLRIPSPPSFLRPNMTVSVTVEARRSTGGFAVPAAAVLTESGHSFVHVVRDGRIERIPVRVGMRSSTRTEVFARLADGDSVVVGDVPSSRVGAEVQATPWSPTAVYDPASGGLKIPFH